MITPEIISYINTEKVKNTPDSIIKQNLLNNGWKEEDINEALAAISAKQTTGGAINPIISPEILLEIKAYRRKLRFITFVVLASLVIILILENLYSTGNTDPAVFIVTGPVLLLIAWGLACIASLGTSPKHNKALEIVGIIGKIIGAVIVTIMIFYGILFLLCAFVLSTGGAKGF